MKLCECGCGCPVTLATKTNKKLGHIKGNPHRFIRGHARVLNCGSKHYKWNGGKKIDGRGYVWVINKNHPRAVEGYVREHHLICEKALGKTLPFKAVVHHIDGNRSNNKPSNLVICESIGYHSYLHRRIRAKAICGHANWKKCPFCKKYDSLDNMRLMPNGRTAYHSRCCSDYGKAYYIRKKEKAS